MTAGDWFFLALCIVELAFLGLVLRSEQRASRYWKDLNAHVAKWRAEQAKGKPAA